jgi:hypothetical protein
MTYWQCVNTARQKDIVWLAGRRMKLVRCCNSYVMVTSVPAVQFPQQWNQVFRSSEWGTCYWISGYQHSEQTCTLIFKFSWSTQMDCSTDIQAIHCRRPEFKVTAISYNKLKQFNDTVCRVLTAVNVSKCLQQNVMSKLRTRGSLVFSIFMILMFSSPVKCSDESSSHGGDPAVMLAMCCVATVSWAYSKPSNSYRVKRSANSAASGSELGCKVSKHCE